MSNDIKYTFATLKKQDGQVGRMRIYAVASAISATYQLRYFYLQGFTSQDKRILDMLNNGEGPLDRSIEELRSLKKIKTNSATERIFKDKFAFHSNEIILEDDAFDAKIIKESKETQRILEDFMDKNPKGSFVEYLRGIFQEKEINGQKNIVQAVEHYIRGHTHNFCQYCSAKLLRMNLETMELKQSSLAQNFEKAFEICGYIFSNSGIFYFIEEDRHHAPVFYYVSVMMDIYRDFRDFVYRK